MTYVVRPGDSFWSIAVARLAAADGDRIPGHTTVSGDEPVTGAEAAAGDEAVARYWVDLIAVNRNRLPVPGVPDLLFVGDLLELPPT